MRILSQDGLRFDIEYENCHLVVNEKCYEIEAETNNPNFTPVMASYSSIEKCRKSMDMLHKKYSSSRLVKDKYCKLEELTKVKHDFGDFSEVVSESNYFRFPLDSEVEV